jgi:hypothetical protein
MDTPYKNAAKLQPTNPRAGLQAAFLANKFCVMLALQICSDAGQFDFAAICTGCANQAGQCTGCKIDA